MEISPRPRPVGRTDAPLAENTALRSAESPSKPRSRDDRLVFRKPIQPASASKGAQIPSIKTDLPVRRRSVQREPPLLGPRPLERTGKRFFSAGTSPSYHLRPSALPQSASMSVLEKPTSAPASQSPGFLPSMNFDNFQSSMGGANFEVQRSRQPMQPLIQTQTPTSASSAHASSASSSNFSSTTSRQLRRVPVLSIDASRPLAALKITAPSPSTDGPNLSPSRRSARRQTMAIAPNGLSRATAPTWSSSAKAVQTPKPHDASPTKTLVKSPSRPAVTPTTSQRRQSGRLSGLGARTISPTDAKRLRRLSLAQPNGSHLSPSPQPKVPSIARSPSTLTLKTNLARYTPESVGSQGLASSIPSSSSYSSLNTYVTAVPRLGQSPSLSRLPLLKGRNVYSSNGMQDDEEFVPPVPAIPKAYESPKDQIDTPFFSALAPRNSDEPPTSVLQGKSATDNTPTRPVPVAIDINREPLTPAIQKRPAQARLPPLNVLPLSTPTAARIASLHDNDEKTPTKVRNYSRTPTTPMTASKATFPNYTEDSRRPSYRLRTSTSQHDRLDTDYEAFADQDSQSRQITPFSSRSRADYSKPDEYTLVQGVPNQNSEHFRQRATSHAQGAEQSNIPLRRKFSLTWRRTSSKNNLAESVAPVLPQPELSEHELPRREVTEPELPGSDAPASRWRPASRSTSWSVMKPLMPESRRRNKTLDRVEDETVANEELRRMSGRRKEVESAARETDRLTRLATAKQGLRPSHAIQSPLWALNIYEKGEIIDYREGVYFGGNRSAKKHVGDISSAGTTNFGYDDERGDYSIVVGDHLAYRYEVVDFLGKGSFGQVVRCIDHKMGGLVAVKIIRNKKRFHQQALVEVNILKKLREWDPDGGHATLSITSSFYFRSHLCIVTPCLSINLYELIRANSFQGFSLAIIRRFAQQILACLELLQDKQVIHCDLKPENILLCDPRRADIRVIDFGSSCKADEKVYTYIQSRFYRSPEVILGNEYGLGIDMWSFGCILAELHTGYPIFPGENEQEQLACIMEVFGPPPRSLVEKCARRKLFFDSSSKPRVTISSKGRRRRPSSKTLSASLKCSDEPFLDFITQCLAWDPKRRLRPDQAVQHPFIVKEAMPRPDKTRSRMNGNSTKTPSGGGGGGGSSVSPTKRLQTSRTRARPLPEPPLKLDDRRQQDASSTAVRSGVPVAVNIKRPSQAVVGASNAMQSNSSLPRLSSDRVDMAAQAARESMGVRAGTASSHAKWRP